VRYLRCRIGVAAAAYNILYYMIERDVFVLENEVAAAAGPPDERMRSRDTTAPLRPPSTGPAARASYNDDIGTVIIRSPVGGRRFSVSVLWSGFYYFFFLPPHLPTWSVPTCIIIIL
jgi:hypothetical protein